MKKQLKKLTLRKTTIVSLCAAEQKNIHAGRAAATSRDPVSCKILCPNGNRL